MNHSQSLALLATALLALTANAAKLEETTTQTYPQNELTSFSVKNVNGSIYCEGWEHDEIELEYTIKVKANSDEAAQEYLEKVDVEIVQENESFAVKTKLPKNGKGSFLGWIFGQKASASVSYKVKIPSDMNASVSSVNGSVKIYSVDGKVRANTVNGRIEGNELANVKKMETVNGAVNCKITTSSQSEGSSFSTVNGSVKVFVPETASYSAKVTTVNGGIHTDFPLSENAVKKRRSLETDINGGGAPLKISTVNGSATIGINK